MELKGAPSDESLDKVRPSSVATFVDSCTLHGIRHIFSPGGLSVRRLLWLLAFLGSLSILVLQSLDRVQYYLRYPYVTKLEEVSTPLMVFPAVTVCNLNEFRFSRMTRNDLYHAGELLALLDERMEIVEPRFVDAQVMVQLRKRADFRVYKPRPFSMREFYERAGHELREMLLHCKFHGMNCTPQDFQTVSLLLGIAPAKGVLKPWRCRCSRVLVHLPRSSTSPGSRTSIVGQCRPGQPCGMSTFHLYKYQTCTHSGVTPKS